MDKCNICGANLYESVSTIPANAGLIIPFLRCKKPFKLKGKLKRKQFLKLNCKNKQGVIDDFN